MLRPVLVPASDSNADALAYELFGQNVVPPFHPMACGSPGKSPIWKGTWKRASKDFRSVDAQPNIDRFKQFLNLRCCGGKLLGDFFLEPEFKGNSWWRFRCHSDYLPKFDSAPDADWNKAWHGTKMENLYAIIAAKTLIPGPTQLEHVANAVYVCGDHIRSHANFYMRYVPLCQDGVFWGGEVGGVCGSE